MPIILEERRCCAIVMTHMNRTFVSISLRILTPLVSQGLSAPHIALQRLLRLS